LSSELELRVKKCFIKLYKIISNKKITLFKTFQAYDFEKKGDLTLDEFEKIMMRLDQSFTHEEVEAAFTFIDTDQSKTI
jgi:Ca2+-binding EF-hand superfamily protein